MPELGRIAFDAFNSAAGVSSVPWEHLDPKAHAVWDAVAQAVLRASDPEADTPTPRRGSSRQHRPRDPDKRYVVDLCGYCAHPGGTHMLGRVVGGEWIDLGGACKCGNCPGWDEENIVRHGSWTDRQGAEFEATAAVTPEPISDKESSDASTAG